MPDGPLEFLRGVLGVLCVLFAHLAGRSWMAARKGWQRRTRLFPWMLRAVICAVALAFRHRVDAVVIGALSLAAAAFAAGAWVVWRQKPPEDLSRDIFPEGPDTP